MQSCIAFSPDLNQRLDARHAARGLSPLLRLAHLHITVLRGGRWHCQTPISTTTGTAAGSGHARRRCCGDDTNQHEQLGVKSACPALPRPLLGVTWPEMVRSVLQGHPLTQDAATAGAFKTLKASLARPRLQN